MKEKIKYFNSPTQVRFIDPFETELTGEARWLGGIAYGDEVICGECGSVIELNEIEDLEVLKWVSISDEILGGLGNED